jgi:hypothetical protein
MWGDAVRRAPWGRAGHAESSKAMTGQRSWTRTFSQGQCHIGRADHFGSVASCSGGLSTPAAVGDLLGQ